MEKFAFLKTDDLFSDEIKLVLKEKKEARPEINYVPAYVFDICLLDDTVIGSCDLRIGYTESLYDGGHIGYRITEHYRGNHYAAKACLLLFKLARKHGMKYYTLLVALRISPQKRR